jgi:hypothetical protein
MSVSRSDDQRDGLRPDLFKGQKVNLSHVFAGQNVGVTQVGERIWLVTFTSEHEQRSDTSGPFPCVTRT